MSVSDGSGGALGATAGAGPWDVRAALFGREELLEEAERLPAHALLLAGPEDVGRDALARELAIRLGRLVPPFVDLWEAEAPVAIGEAREAMRTMEAWPLASACRVLLVRRAERLSPVVQNALLRFVEEPPEHVRIVFTARHVAALLPTLASRFVVRRLAPLPWERFRAFGAAAGWDEAETRDRFRRLGGWPMRALRCPPAPPDIGVEGAGPARFARAARPLVRDPEGALAGLRRLLQETPADTPGQRRQVLAGLLLVDEAGDRLRRNQDALLVFENLLLGLEELGLLHRSAE